MTTQFLLLKGFFDVPPACGLDTFVPIQSRSVWETVELPLNEIESMSGAFFATVQPSFHARYRALFEAARSPYIKAIGFVPRQWSLLQPLYATRGAERGAMPRPNATFAVQSEGDIVTTTEGVDAVLVTSVRSIIRQMLQDGEATGVLLHFRHGNGTMVTYRWLKPI